jgi:hypothetical protein
MAAESESNLLALQHLLHTRKQLQRQEPASPQITKLIRAEEVGLAQFEVGR